MAALGCGGVTSTAAATQSSSLWHDVARAGRVLRVSATAIESKLFATARRLAVVWLYALRLVGGNVNM